MNVISPAVVLSLVNTIKDRIQNIKVYRGRCRNLELRCNLLISALNEDDGEAPLSAAHADALNEAQTTLLIVRGRVEEWAMLSTLKSLLRQDDIREGVDELQRRVDTCIAGCHVRISRQMAQDFKEQALYAQHDILEIREMIQNLLAAFTEYTKNPSTLPNDNIFRIVVQEETHDIQSESASMHSTISVGNGNSQSFDSQSQAFSDVMRELGRSLVNLELTQPPNMLMPMNLRHRNLRRLSLQSTRSTSSNLSLASVTSMVSRLWSPPQIPPLDFGEETFWQTGQFISTEPFPAPGGSSLHSGQSLYTDSERMSITSGSGVGRSTPGSQHRTEGSSILNVWTASGPPSPLDIALTTRVSVYKTNGRPRVITTATMEGLIHYLLLKSDEEDKGEHDTFFIAHPAFISPLNVLGMLIRRFEEASRCSDELACQDTQARVMHLINNWLRNEHVIFADDHLAELRNFIINVNQLNTLDELVLEVVQGIQEKASSNFPPSPLIPSFDSAMITSPTPSQLAMALARLEREGYQRILPIEYMAYAGKLPSSCPNLTAAIALNQRINNWVQSSILDMDLDGAPNEIESRCITKRFFVQTAKACHAIRNFSSLGAIMEALQSKAIRSLTLTHERMLLKERQYHQRLVNFLKSDSNYRTYRKALSQVGSRGCIPWHVVHLRDIHDIMRGEQDVDEQHDPPLINFEKWAHLKEKAMSALQYRDVPFQFEEQAVQAAMEYLKKGLQSASVGEDFSRVLQTNSKKLVKNESLARGNLNVEEATKRAGFGVASGRIS